MFKLLPILLLLIATVLATPDGGKSAVVQSRVLDRSQSAQSSQSLSSGSSSASALGSSTRISSASLSGLSPVSLSAAGGAVASSALQIDAIDDNLLDNAAAGSDESDSTLSLSAAAAAAASSVRSSSIRLGGGSVQLAGTSRIQHRILPAEIIPLPLTISTRPGLRTVIAPETITIHQPAVAKIGELVQKIPTAVSHQSQTVVHNHARVVTPIVAPAVRTVTSQVVRAYHTPLLLSAQSPVITKYISN